MAEILHLPTGGGEGLIAERWESGDYSLEAPDPERPYHTRLWRDLIGWALAADAPQLSPGMSKALRDVREQRRGRAVRKLELLGKGPYAKQIGDMLAQVEHGLWYLEATEYPDKIDVPVVQKAMLDVQNNRLSVVRSVE